ncbi:MAG: ferrochelatase [Gammaproteobacteria bacterium]|nr:ferrochelatase [Gammaproteobacteria bacterium]
MNNIFSGIKVRGQTNYSHGTRATLGVLVVNLGTPDEPTPKAVRRYLAEFLSDTRVVEIPRLLWKMILHGIILRVRPAKSAKAYQRVWSDQGSPLMAGSADLTDQLSERLTEKLGDSCTTVLAMRYGNPTIRQGMETLQSAGAQRIIVLPLYPQYSGATSGSVSDGVLKNLLQWRWVPELRLMGAYHDDPQYISSVAQSVRSHWLEKGQSERLLISFHGMPKATLLAGDPYYCQCHKTARLLAVELELDEDQWEMVFQSRFGSAEWLKPYAAERWVEMAAEGVRHLTVVCPGFAIDCLETLDEIANEGREEFLAAGGEKFDYVPALNASTAHVELMLARVLRQASGWPELEQPVETNIMQQQSTLSRDLAIAAGAN